MERGDPQQQLLCAAISAFAHRTALFDSAGPILAARLRANHISGDAKIAAPALLAIGDAAIPLLEPLLDSLDLQERELARLILIDLDAIRPPDPNERFRLVHITDRALDPAMDLGLSTEDLE